MTIVSSPPVPLITRSDIVRLHHADPADADVATGQSHRTCRVRWLAVTGVAAHRRRASHRAQHLLRSRLIAGTAVSPDRAGPAGLTPHVPGILIRVQFRVKAGFTGHSRKEVVRGMHAGAVV